MWKNYIYKTAFVCLYKQLAYIHIGQGLIDSLHTFAKLKNIFAKPIPLLDPELALKDIKGVVFAYFVNNDLGAALNNKQMFTFLYKYYFPRLA